MEASIIDLMGRMNTAEAAIATAEAAIAIVNNTANSAKTLANSAADTAKSAYNKAYNHKHKYSGTTTTGDGYSGTTGDPI